MTPLKFLIDESADARLAMHLNALGHDALTVAGAFTAGLSDRQVLELANEEQRVLICDDRDFGELVVKHRYQHAGVILFRLQTTLLPLKIERLDDVLEKYADRLDRLLVVTHHRIRVYPPDESVDASTI